MSDKIKHECGIAIVRLLKPLSYYIEKYGTPTYALNKMYILMEKQRNRGQDGAGIANIKINQKPGKRYISRYRSTDQDPIKYIFEKIGRKYRKAKKDGGEQYYDEKWLKDNCSFTGEIWLGHLRYGTYGKNNIENCHPFLRQNNWRSRNLVIAGNFNMTNVNELFDILVNLGQHPKQNVDTVTVMEKIGHFLDSENEQIKSKYKNIKTNVEITQIIENELNIINILNRACKDFDGGYTIGGIIGHGDLFVARDPSGIRPAYYYIDDEVVVVASEKPAIKTAFDVDYNKIKEIRPGYALVTKKNGYIFEEQFIQPKNKTACSFERIYFSRGNDPDIFNERKKLGQLLVPQILEAINYDFKDTIFSYIPNTAEIAFHGLINALDDYLIQKKNEVFIQQKPFIGDKELLLSGRPRIEKIVLKDAKLRTFISDNLHRDELVSHVYDTTYEIIRKGVDTLVIMDDSIVRGTTLEKSILTMLNKLEPKKIIVVSSAPQIRYPDCYGIDMSNIGEFVAFRAMLSLIKDASMENQLEEVKIKCKEGILNGSPKNYINELYDMFTYKQISNKIAQIVKPKDMKCELVVIYQTVENLHKACPNHVGDWYFTGNFPTKGGVKVANQAFINFMERKLTRAY